MTLTTKGAGANEVEKIQVEGIYVDARGTVAYKRSRYSNWEPLPTGAFYALEAYDDLYNSLQQSRWLEERCVPGEGLQTV